jgi:hypothetical protein
MLDDARTDESGSSAASRERFEFRVREGYRYYVVWLLFTVYVFNFVDRQILMILIQPIKQEFHFSDTAMGLLGGLAFAALYSTLRSRPPKPTARDKLRYFWTGNPTGEFTPALRVRCRHTEPGSAPLTPQSTPLPVRFALDRRHATSPNCSFVCPARLSAAKRVLAHFIAQPAARAPRTGARRRRAPWRARTGPRVAAPPLDTRSRARRGRRRTPDR